MQDREDRSELHDPPAEAARARERAPQPTADNSFVPNLTRGTFADRIRLDGPNAQLFRSMGQIYAGYNHSAVAAGYNALAASLDPGHAESQIALGASLFKEQQHEAALKCFQRAMQLNPASPGARQGMARVCNHLGVTVAQPAPVPEIPAVVRWRMRPEQQNAPLALFLAKSIGEDHCLIGTFEQTLDWNYIAFNLNELGRLIGPCIDLFFLHFARDLNVGHVFLEFAQLSKRQFDPRPETLHTIRKKTGASIGLFPCETVKPITTTLTHLYRAAIDYVAAIDAPLKLDDAHNGESTTVLNLWAPPNPIHFFASDAPRPVDASFVGRTKMQQRYRERFLAHLRDHGVNVTVAGSDEGGWLTSLEYGDMMRRSKIVINFSRAMMVSMWDREPDDGRLMFAHHTKARVFEAMSCGALLLEQENKLTRRFFEPHVHYAPFSNEQQLYEQVVKYLNDDAARVAIANAGYKRVMSEFNARKFWHIVLECAERYRMQRATHRHA